MFSEPSERHHIPHFHAYYGEHVAVFSVAPVALIIGFVPPRQQRLVEAWTELHEDELLADWALLEPILEGEIYGPLRDLAAFAQVTLDLEIHTVVWPSSADFDPVTLHDWPEHEAAFRGAAERWSRAKESA